MNKTLVITGGSRGIGLAIVELFAQHGYNVIFCARNQEKVNTVQASLNAQFPNQRIVGVAVDATKVEDLDTFTSIIHNHTSQVDVLINNAGYFIPGSILGEEEGALSAMLDTNLMSAYHMTRRIAPMMIKNGSGYIFNMCSIASLHAYPNGGSYSISKYALLGFSDNLRLELLPHNIGVCAVLPGATMTDSWAGSGVSADRIMAASDIATMIHSATKLSPQAVMEKIIMRPLLGDL